MVGPSRLVPGQKFFWVCFICTLEGCILLWTYFFFEKVQIWNTLMLMYQLTHSCMYFSAWLENIYLSLSLSAAAVERNEVTSKRHAPEMWNWWWPGSCRANDRWNLLLRPRDWGRQVYLALLCLLVIVVDLRERKLPWNWKVNYLLCRLDHLLWLSG